MKELKIDYDFYIGKASRTFTKVGIKKWFSGVNEYHSSLIVHDPFITNADFTELGSGIVWWRKRRKGRELDNKNDNLCCI